MGMPVPPDEDAPARPPPLASPSSPSSTPPSAPRPRAPEMPAAPEGPEGPEARAFAFGSEGDLSVRVLQARNRLAEHRRTMEGAMDRSSRHDQLLDLSSDPPRGARLERRPSILRYARRTTPAEEDEMRRDRSPAGESTETAPLRLTLIAGQAAVQAATEDGRWQLHIVSPTRRPSPAGDPTPVASAPPTASSSALSSLSRPAALDGLNTLRSLRHLDPAISSLSAGQLPSSSPGARGEILSVADRERSSARLRDLQELLNIAQEALSAVQAFADRSRLEHVTQAFASARMDGAVESPVPPTHEQVAELRRSVDTIRSAASRVGIILTASATQTRTHTSTPAFLASPPPSPPPRTPSVAPSFSLDSASDLRTGDTGRIPLETEAMDLLAARLGRTRRQLQAISNRRNHDASQAGGTPRLSSTVRSPFTAFSEYLSTDEMDLLSLGPAPRSYAAAAATHPLSTFGEPPILSSTPPLRQAFSVLSAARNTVEQTSARERASVVFVRLDRNGNEVAEQRDAGGSRELLGR